MADSIFGRNLPEAREILSASVSAVTVNATTILYVRPMIVGGGKFRVESVQWVASAVLNDADGTILVSVFNNDLSEGADDILVNAQSVEGGVAHRIAAFTLAAEGAEKEFTLEEGDTLRVTITNNTATIDTNGALSIFVIGFPLPLPYDTSAGVKYESSY